MPDPTGLFSSAVPQYARYRAGYPADRVDELAAATGLDATRHAVDVGCGTGQLTLHLARHARWVTAIDPVAAMLEHGRAAAGAAGLTNVDWVRGEAAQLPSLVEPGARVAAFAASFHWTDRARVLAALDGILEPGGSVVVLDDALDEGDLPDWDRAITRIRARYAGLEAEPGAVRPLPETHREVLERSAFSDVAVSTWAWERRLDVDEVVGLQLTYSFSSPALLGDRVGAFCDEVRSAVLALHPGGVVTEPLRLAVYTATRPAARHPARRTRVTPTGVGHGTATDPVAVWREGHGIRLRSGHTRAGSVVAHGQDRRRCR